MSKHSSSQSPSSPLHPSSRSRQSIHSRSAWGPFGLALATTLLAASVQTARASAAGAGQSPASASVPAPRAGLAESPESCSPASAGHGPVSTAGSSAGAPVGGVVGNCGQPSQEPLTATGVGAGAAATEGAPTARPQAQQAELQELRRRLEVLAEELERLRSGEAPEQELTEARRRALGLAPSAASVYRRRHGLSIAGYGEMLYENYASANERGVRVVRPSQLDFLRLVLYSGYRFTDRFVFNSEIELEHANEISVEFAFVDFVASDALTLRGGMVLVPMGLANEFHEPTVFVGARRTETETRLLPSTWRENGAGVLGAIGRVSYRAYVVNGLNAAGFTAAGLRGGRQKGSRARADDLAFVGRLDITPTPGVFLGGSVYGGQSDQGQFTVDDRRLAVGTRIVELHAQVQARGFDLRGLYARARLDDVAGLNRALGLQGSQSIGEVLAGGYVQVGYDCFAQTGRGVSLVPFYRFERVNTQARVPAGFASNPATNGTYQTFGVELKPLVQVVVKADYQRVSNRAGTGVSQFNVGLGYAF